jgi:hypothetical protein
MVLTISTSYRPAKDLGFLPHKNASRVQAQDYAELMNWYRKAVD